MRGKMTGIQMPFRAVHPVITFEVDADPEQLEKYLEKDLDISIKQHRERRSLDANACLWWCLGKIAQAITADPWEIYLLELSKYGQFTHLMVKSNAVEAVRRQWREIRVVGETEVNGEPYTELLCFFGSSTYNSEEFSRLLDGVISDMKEMHLETPADDHMRAIIKDLERKEHDKTGR
jgi:hypothetical protein